MNGHKDHENNSAPLPPLPDKLSSASSSNLAAEGTVESAEPPFRAILRSNNGLSVEQYKKKFGSMSPVLQQQPNLSPQK